VLEDYIRYSYKQLNWYDHVQRMIEEKHLKKGLVSIWQKKKKGKTSKLVDAGSNNWNEGEGNYQGRMNRWGRIEKKNNI
jgi:hypothetical protein